MHVYWKTVPQVWEYRYARYRQSPTSEQVVFPESVKTWIRFPIPLKQLWARPWAEWNTEKFTVVLLPCRSPRSRGEDSVCATRTTQGTARSEAPSQESYKLYFGGRGRRILFGCSPLQGSLPVFSDFLLVGHGDPSKLSWFLLQCSRPLQLRERVLISRREYKLFTFTPTLLSALSQY